MSGEEMRVQALEGRVLLASMAPDASFGDGGDVRVPIEVSHDDAASIARVQADGKVVVAGVTSINHARRLLLTRLNANGSLDKRFGRGGMIVHEMDLVATRDWFDMTDLAIQPDGKIVLAGHVSNMFALARFNADGSRDASFGDGGIFTPGVGPGGETLGWALRVLVLPDGGVLGVGRMRVNAEEANYDIGIVRLRADGSPDATFGGGDGVVTTDLFEWDTAHDVAIDRLGRLVVVGASVNEGDPGLGERDVHHGVVLRYERDGERDASFAFSGTAWAMQEDSLAYLQRVLVHGKKIITGGYTSEGSVVFRLNERGRWLQWDSPFGRKGTLQWEGRDGVSEILPRAKGGFTVVMTDNGITGDNEPDAERNLHVIHLNVDGSRAKSAGKERHVKTVYGNARHYIATRAARGGDGYVVVGRKGAGTEQDFAVLRLREDGRPDKSFGRNGRVAIDHRDKAPLHPDGLLVLRSGKVLAWGGYFELSGWRYFVRLNQDGSLDESFGRGGLSHVTLPGLSSDLLVTEASNGDIVIAGQSSSTESAIMRLRADGSPVTIIGNGGIVRDDGIVYPSLLHVMGDDTMLLGGHFEGPAYQDVSYVLHWFESDGKRMPKSARLHFDAFQRFHVALPQEDGGVLVLGIVSEATEMVSPMEPTRPVNGRLTMLRYHADASRDESFGDKGIRVVSSVEIDRILGVRQLPGGDLVVAGLDTIPDSGGGFDGDVVMMRLSADGTLEGSWASDVEGRVGRAQLQPDGDLLLLNEDETLLVRANGEVDDAFDAGSISFEAATMDAEGDLIIARPYRRGLLIRKFDVDG